MRNNIGLINRDIVKLLENDAKRKPDIAVLLSNCHNMTDIEIEEAVVPLKWYKDALKIARDRKQYNDLLTNFDYELISDIPTSINIIVGNTALYTGFNVFVSTANGKSLFELRNNDLIFLDSNGGAWVNQTYLPDNRKILLSYTLIKSCSRQEYIVDYANHLLSRF